MTHLQKVRIPFIVKWVSSNSSWNHLKPSKSPLRGSFLPLHQNPRCYCRKKSVESEKCENLDMDSESIGRIHPVTRRKAQKSLLEYFHCTRGFRFEDAENMSRNSPHFVGKLLKKVERVERDYALNLEHSIARFLRYHPINEFEPFFESLGLEPSELDPFLPRNLMFLSDDNFLLDNYHVLCCYGIAPNKIGKIYKEAPEVFQYDNEILQSKLQVYEELGLSQSFLVKAIASRPSLLIGGVNSVFVKVFEELNTLGIEYSWIEGHLLSETSYNWSQIFDLLCLFIKIGCNKEQLGELISRHPDILFEGSGNRTFSLIGFLLKFGSTMNEIRSMFVRFPHIEVGKFLCNMRQCCLFLIDINMEVEEIQRIVRSHTVMIGSCSLKKIASLLTTLKVGKRRLRQIIEENPEELKNWVRGSRIDPLPKLPESGRYLGLQKAKIKFLLDLGFIENSNEMKRALKVFRGKGRELQERYDCFVKAGLDQNDVSRMVRAAPHILNQSKDVIEMKIDFLVNDLGYPVSSLVAFPGYVCYTLQRVKLRSSMYYWLKDQGAAEPNLALSTFVACPDKYFIKHYVNRLPGGPEFWVKLKKQLWSN
ncbi:transcription termination factor MTEF18, mitochondrial-like [Malania oleifera]|uniref:transcription termination factor MTEF18, mitochondrial-like n=1 Tax=Malania oleifera TaxID=397392 RepID=UPI0025AE2D45|nr:transcription termination factor MTEF18, mitochondrial-like [Malania oleifera]XP_057982505.1 transcription termination factor MTEF18, mitochondrial-like [Malania oleifera]XP_057982506.1 transcription termination factor MTEF18, mitochondrial-like [Malania oleifera]XP_057982507.1 transcription termination factor MTEF18, mitochondrial-like [Malania oleifera]